jgi:ABC-type xylose transport system substrate-binding protein
MRVRLPKICGLLVFIGVVSCCGQAQQKPEIKIGISLEATKGERWQTDLYEFQRRAEQLGYEPSAQLACAQKLYSVVSTPEEVTLNTVP